MGGFTQYVSDQTKSTPVLDFMEKNRNGNGMVRTMGKINTL